MRQMPQLQWVQQITLLCSTNYCVKQNTVSTLASNIHLFNIVESGDNTIHHQFPLFRYRKQVYLKHGLKAYYCLCYMIDGIGTAVQFSLRFTDYY